MKDEWNISPYLGVFPLVFNALKRTTYVGNRGLKK
jgi:hypothetical protein